MRLDALTEKRLADDTIPKDVNPDLLESLPKLPNMNRVVMQNEDTNPELGIPFAVVKLWQMDPVFGKEFVAWLDKFTEQYKIVDPAAGGPDPPGPPGKRKADGQCPEASPKKAKIMDGIVEMSSIKEDLIHECKLISKDAPSLQIRSSHTIYIVNTSPTVEWTSAMVFIAGFGKGSFKFVKNDNPHDDGVIVFNVTSHKDLVVLNGVVLELGKVVMDQREKKPDAQVCYHKMEIANEDPKTFTLTLEHHVAFFLSGVGQGRPDHVQQCCNEIPNSDMGIDLEHTCHDVDGALVYKGPHAVQASCAYFGFCAFASGTCITMLASQPCHLTVSRFSAQGQH